MANYKDGTGNYKGGGVTLSEQEVILTADKSTTSTTYIDTGLSLVIPTTTGGKAIVIATCTSFHATAGSKVNIVLFDDGSTTTGDSQHLSPGGSDMSEITLVNVFTLDGSTIAVYMKGETGTSVVRGLADDSESKIQTFEVA